MGDGCGGGELDGEVVVVVDGGTVEGDEPGDGDVVAIQSLIEYTDESLQLDISHISKSVMKIFTKSTQVYV